MRFYPRFSLYTHYQRHLPASRFFSGRIPDKTIKSSLDNLNRALNICEHHHAFLDFGAGNGRYSTALLPEFAKGYGIEVEKDEILLQLAKRYPHFHVLFGKSALTKMKGPIDCIILMDVLEHISPKEVGALLHTFSSMQDKGGVIYIATPNALQCGMVEKSGIFYQRFKHGHQKHYHADEVIALFRPYQYHPVFVLYEDFPLRLLIKQINVGCAYIDKKLLNVPLYSIFSYPLIMILNVFFSIMGPFVAWDEYRNRQDNLSSRTMVLAFKKV